MDLQYFLTVNDCPICITHDDERLWHDERVIHLIHIKDRKPQQKTAIFKDPGVHTQL